MTAKMTNAQQSESFLASVQATHRTLLDLYAKPNKTNADWAAISELKTTIHAGYDAAQVHATLALVDGVRELCRRLPASAPTTETLV